MANDATVKKGSRGKAEDKAQQEVKHIPADARRENTTLNKLVPVVPTVGHCETTVDADGNVHITIKMAEFRDSLAAGTFPLKTNKGYSYVVASTEGMKDLNGTGLEGIKLAMIVTASTATVHAQLREYGYMEQKALTKAQLAEQAEKKMQALEERIASSDERMAKLMEQNAILMEKLLAQK